jgi:triosephosphate isomerase
MIGRKYVSEHPRGVDMPSRTMLIAGNWKMNGTRAEARTFLDRLAVLKPEQRPRRALLICPPATLIAEMAAPLAALGAQIGGQDCHGETKGAFTGDISAAMLADLGSSHIIVGHSERRTLHRETDAIVQAKAKAALAAGLTPIICVGETWEQREAGHAETVVRTQIGGSVPDGIAADRLVIAYEPVWAIGTGRTPTTADIDAIHGVIRESLSAKVAGEGGLILYGGSVKPGNALEILALEQVDGALIGGASLLADDFMAIANASPA